MCILFFLHPRNPEIDTKKTFFFPNMGFVNINSNKINSNKTFNLIGFDYTPRFISYHSSTP